MEEPESSKPESADSRRRWLPIALVVAAVLIAVPVALSFSSNDDSTSATSGNSSSATSGGEPAALPGVVESGPAPDFDAELLEGGFFRLSNHLADDGRPVFLNLWASWCFPCREEMPAIDALAAAHPEILFLGVAVEDSLDGANGFAEEIGVAYPLAFDETNSVSDLYPVLGLPATFLITADGEVAAKLFGGSTIETFEQFLGHLN